MKHLLVLLHSEDLPEETCAEKKILADSTEPLEEQTPTNRIYWFRTSLSTVTNKQD